MRHKSIIGFKMHASIKFAADFALGLVTEKLRSRIKIFTTLDSVDCIDRKVLPQEYGGTMPMAKMIGNCFWAEPKYYTLNLLFRNFHLYALFHAHTLSLLHKIELWKDEVAAKQEIVLNNDKMRVNLNMYSLKAREGAVSALKQLNCASSDGDANLYGLQGSFRKLEVD